MSESFSILEAELVIDRLGLPDCLAEVLADSDDELAKQAVWNNDFAVEIACRQLIVLIESGKPVAEIVAQSTPLMRWLLTDAIEGSTWLVRHSNPGVSHLERATATRIANSTVRKLRHAGLAVEQVPAG